MKKQIECRRCKKKILRFQSQIKESNYCSKQCYYEDRSERMKKGEIKYFLPDTKGKNNPNYKNGLWILYNKLRKGKVKSKCMDCSIELKGRKMHIHHLDKNRNNNSPENLLILCSKCHGQRHRITFVKLKCDNCGKGIEKWKGYINKRNYCSSKCMYEHRKIINFKR